ncbi:MAG: hypothetical protein EOP49_03580 [Sphingobacteriales bacterium]|nr:MAG: hypothetical protein EOP49_03580 [Sphingobacteriales bacterium]
MDRIPDFNSDQIQTAAEIRFGIRYGMEISAAGDRQYFNLDAVTYTDNRVKTRGNGKIIAGLALIGAGSLIISQSVKLIRASKYGGMPAFMLLIISIPVNVSGITLTTWGVVQKIKAHSRYRTQHQ